MITRVVVALLLASVITHSRGAAQAAPRVAVIADRPACPACQIQLTPHALLGDTAGEGEFPRQSSALRVDDRGRFFVSFRSDDMPMVFTSAGRFERRLGRAGAGPGEFRIPLVTGVQDDTAWVIDPSNARITALTVLPGSVSMAGAWTMSGLTLPPFSAVRLAGGSILVNAAIASADRIGLPLHLVKPGGEMVSFGARNPEHLPHLPRLGIRAIAPGRSGGAWVAHTTKYELEQYDQRGVLLATWQRNVPWFRPHRGEQNVSEEQPPQPRIAAIAEDRVGRVWVLSVVADSRHRQAFDPRRPDQPSNVVNLERPDLYVDTIIEVFDVRRGVLLASRRVDESWGSIPGLHGDGILLAKSVQTPDGGWQLRVERVELAGAGR